MFAVILLDGVEGAILSRRGQRVPEFIRDIQKCHGLIVTSEVKPAQTVWQQNQLFHTKDVGAMLVFDHTADCGSVLINADYPLEGQHDEEVVAVLPSCRDPGGNKLHTIRGNELENDVPP